MGEPVFQARRPPPIERGMNRLRTFLADAAARGADTWILCDNDGQARRLEDLIADRRGTPPPGCHLVVGSVTSGFRIADSDPVVSILTDHEIFRRSRKLRRGRRFRGAAALESLAQLSPGDHIVHMEHGIGRFQGLERVVVGGESIEALVVEYDGGEVLRVPVHGLDKVERWVGTHPGDRPARLHRIGGKRWKTLRRKTEAAINRMTAELLELYATRRSRPGHAFSPDTRWQQEMESAFLYEDTPDQHTAVEDIKRDMESPRIMDRLVCGDAGYGKTEVAIRAAFKAVQDGKQVAVLAPTTVLVAQHVKTFGDRLADYPVIVASLSRFDPPATQREVLAGLARGTVDIVIGTQRLLSGDVAFHDLGLVVIDEEQRLGVRQKERLKRLRTTVDVLTLSATPIPRTLYLSLAGIRDLSLIRTPPRDRMAVMTHVIAWSDHLIAEALPARTRPGRPGLLPAQPGRDDRHGGRTRAAAPARRGDRRGPRPDGRRAPRPRDDGLRRGPDRRAGLLVHHRERPRRGEREHPDRERGRPLRALAAVPDPGPGGTVGPARVLLPDRARGDHARGREAAAGAGTLHGAGQRLPDRAPRPGGAGCGQPPGRGPVGVRPRRGAGHLHAHDGGGREADARRARHGGVPGPRGRHGGGCLAARRVRGRPAPETPPVPAALPREEPGGRGGAGRGDRRPLREAAPPKPADSWTRRCSPSRDGPPGWTASWCGAAGPASASGPTWCRACRDWSGRWAAKR